MRGFRGVGCNLFFSDFCRDQASSTVQVKSIVQEPYLLLLAHYDSSSCFFKFYGCLGAIRARLFFSDISNLVLVTPLLAKELLSRLLPEAQYICICMTCGGGGGP